MRGLRFFIVYSYINDLITYRYPADAVIRDNFEKGDKHFVLVFKLVLV